MGLLHDLEDGKKREITEQDFDYFLGVLPPVAMPLHWNDDRWAFGEAEYTPAFPRVETVHACCPGLIVTRAELEALGVVAPPEQAVVTLPVLVSPQRPGVRGWPDYRRCVENAPPAHGGGRPDISRADFTWCLLAIDWGWGIEETAARLLQESSKARENGAPYALRTARNAAAAVERRRGPQR